MDLQMYSDTNQTPSFCLTTDTSRHLLRNMSESMVTWAVGLQGMNANTQTWKLYLRQSVKVDSGILHDTERGKEPISVCKVITNSKELRDVRHQRGNSRPFSE